MTVSFVKTSVAWGKKGLDDCATCQIMFYLFFSISVVEIICMFFIFLDFNGTF